MPQGSILGLLLFLIYVNDMLMAVKCDLLLYTDDTSSIVNEVIRAIIGLLFFFIKRFYMQKESNKKYTSRYVLKIFKKRVAYLLVYFF